MIMNDVGLTEYTQSTSLTTSQPSNRCNGIWTRARGRHFCSLSRYMKIQNKVSSADKDAFFKLYQSNKIKYEYIYETCKIK